MVMGKHRSVCHFACICVPLGSRGSRYVKWFVGSGLDTEFICVECAEARDKGLSTETAFVCRECFQHATTEIGELTRMGGHPEIRVVSRPFDQLVHETLIPKECKRILDIAPIKNDSRSTWLLLGDDGRIWRFEAHTEKLESVGRVKITAETVGDSFAGHPPLGARASSTAMFLRRWCIRRFESRCSARQRRGRSAVRPLWLIQVRLL